MLPVVEAVGRAEQPERPAATSVAYLVCRAGGGLHTERLSSRKALILQALVSGRTFGAACAEAGSGSHADRLAEEGARILVGASCRGLVLSVQFPGSVQLAPANGSSNDAPAHGA